MKSSVHWKIQGVNNAHRCHGVGQVMGADQGDLIAWDNRLELKRDARLTVNSLETKAMKVTRPGGELDHLHGFADQRSGQRVVVVDHTGICTVKDSVLGVIVGDHVAVAIQMIR